MYPLNSLRLTLCAELYCHHRLHNCITLMHLIIKVQHWQWGTSMYIDQIQKNSLLGLSVSLYTSSATCHILHNCQCSCPYCTSNLFHLCCQCISFTLQEACISVCIDCVPLFTNMTSWIINEFSWLETWLTSLTELSMKIIHKDSVTDRYLLISMPWLNGQ